MRNPYQILVQNLNILLFGAAATSILLGLGLVKRNEDEENTN